MDTNKFISDITNIAIQAIMKNENVSFEEAEIKFNQQINEATSTIKNLGLMSDISMIKDFINGRVS